MGILLFLRRRGVLFQLVHNINFLHSHWTARWLVAVEKNIFIDLTTSPTTTHTADTGTCWISFAGLGKQWIPLLLNSAKRYCVYYSSLCS